MLLADHTTLRLGGPAGKLVEGTTAEQVVEAVRAADAADEPVLLLAGGSNLVIADAGFAGTVVRVAHRGVSARFDATRVRLDVAAGEPWDEVVERCVDAGFAGVECLAGIPGSTGGTPIQNVGAYGQEVSAAIVSVRVFDRRELRIVDLTPRECGFGYRSSAFKRSDRHVVLGVSFELERSTRGEPVRYAELARALGIAPGARAPLTEIRDAVLAVRRSKGMVVDPRDPDSVSAGSFFTNPILPAERFAELASRAAHRPGGASPPAWPQRDDLVKTSAAWLIERAGYRRGYGTGRVGISSKHSLALINRGGATTAELLELARELRDGVAATFGITLMPEPKLVGVEL